MLCLSLKYLLEMNLLIEIFPEWSTFPDLVQQFLKSSSQSKSLPYGERTLQYRRWFLKPNLHNGKYANTRK